MKLSEQIKDQKISDNIAHECVQLMESQVSAKKGLSGIAFKTLYAGIKAISSDYAFNAIKGLLLPVSKALDPLWAKGLQQNDPVIYLKNNISLTANTILSVTDAKIQKASNTIVKGTYNKIRKSLQDEIEQAVPGLADILGRNVTIMT